MEKVRKYDTRDDFSILMGTRSVSASKAKEETASPTPLKTVKAETLPKEDFSKMKISEVIKRKDEIEMFLSSIEDAHKNSRFPEYTYDRMRKKCANDIGKLTIEIKERGYKSVRKDKENVGQCIRDIKDSIKHAKKKENKIISTEYEQDKHDDRKMLENMAGKIDLISKKLDSASRKIGKGTEKSKSSGDKEIIESVRMLKKEIDHIRSSLSEYVKKSEIEKIMIKPSFSIYGVPKPKMKTGNEVFIEDLSKHRGKEVTIECNLSIFRKIEKDNAKVYWYRIEDQTGSGILTSYQEIKLGQVRVLGEVRTTATGSFYLMFKSLA